MSEVRPTRPAPGSADKVLPWLASPLLRTGLTWLLLLAMLRCVGPLWVHSAQSETEQWLRPASGHQGLAGQVQATCARWLCLVGGPLVLLAVSVASLQYIWQSRWWSHVESTSFGRPQPSLSWFARATLFTAQAIGGIAVLGITGACAISWAEPLLRVEPGTPLSTSASTVGSIAWRLGLVSGGALLVVAVFEVFLRARFLRPDDETAARFARDDQREQAVHPGIARRRKDIAARRVS